MTDINTTHVNPDVAAGTTLNTKPVTKARAGAHGKSSKKLGAAGEVALDVAKAAGMPAKSAKAVAKAADTPRTLTSIYSKLAEWPVDVAGPAPGDYELSLAYPLSASRIGQPSKRALAMAAYLRPDTAKYSVKPMVSMACAAVMGGNPFNDLRNVCRDAIRIGWVTDHGAIATDGKKAYCPVITPAGWAKIKQFRANHPEYDIENPYDAAVAKAADMKAKRAAAAEKAKATREANKGKRKTSDGDDATSVFDEYIVPRPGAEAVADTPKVDGGTPEAPIDETQPTVS